MDYKVIDTVGADALEEGDIVFLDGAFSEIREIDDLGTVINITLREFGDDFDSDPIPFDPDWRIEVYGPDLD